MSIGFRSSSTGDVASPGATVTITLPAGAAASDILIAVFGSTRAGSTSPGSFTAPAGWTVISADSVVQDGTNGVDLVAYWAPGNVASLVFTKTGTISNTGWVCGAFTGVDATTPIDAAGAINQYIFSTFGNAAAVTVATANAWELIVGGDYDKGTFSATGFTVVENAATHAMAALLYNTTPKATGSTGTVSVNDSTTSMFQLLPFALRPGAPLPRRRVQPGWFQ